jgi:hypothetical protein
VVIPQTRDFLRGLSDTFLLVVPHFKKTLRLIICILTVSIATLFFGFKVLTNPVFIKGHLRLNPKDTSAYIERIAVFVKGDNKVLAKTFTDGKGDFEITFTPDKEKSFDFFCHGVGVDTILVGSVRTFQSETPELTFYLPALRKKNALGQVICPKCKKADKVYKIIYGDGIPDHFDDEPSNRDPNSSIIDGQYYKGTCIVGVAKFFCDRDKVEF